MTARDLNALLADKETPETIRSAIAALGAIDDPAWVRATRAEFEEELRTLESQGSLF